ncbi:MAG TPA: HAD family hydrolase [Dehalococcoidia bacterium]|nr:HAD family hydrolase [Dehalococcoidia bacterium]
MQTRAVLFDLGGTLWSSPAEDADALASCYTRGREILVASGCDAPAIETLIDVVEGYLGEWEGIWRDAFGNQTQEPTPKFVADALKRAGIEATAAAVAAFTAAVMEVSVGTARALAPEPGMPEALAALAQRGLRLGVVSNAFMSAQTLQRIMEARGIGPYFDVTVSSADVLHRKPHPKIYEAVLEPLGLSAEEALFVGDRLDADVEGPAALGMRTVLTQQYKAEDPATARVKPDYVIKHLRELVDVIDALLKR